MKTIFLKITNEKQFAEGRNALEAITSKMTQLGRFELLPEEEQKEYVRIAKMIHEWETVHHPLPGQSSAAIIRTLRNRMKEMNIKQKEAANLLGISESRMSDLLRGKRNITLKVVKKMRDKLGIPADFILDNL